MFPWIIGVGYLALANCGVEAFVSPRCGGGTRLPGARSGHMPSKTVLSPLQRFHGHQVPLYQARGASVAKTIKATTFAGKVWPALQKFIITKAVARDIVASVREAVQWQDLVIILFALYAPEYIAKWAYPYLPQRFRPTEEYQARQFGITENLMEFAEISLTCYAVDVLSVVLTTLGFSFPTKWLLAESFSKISYTVWLVRKGLKLKTRLLCKAFRITDIESEDGGRLEILNRFLNGLFVALSVFILSDWLSFKMGMTMKGIIGFSSIGTLAFTLASQDLLTQFVSGLFLSFSDKMYVGDVVDYGDDMSGKVVRMGWMETVLRRSDNAILRAPNALLANKKMTNQSRVRESQVEQTVRISYENVELLPELLDRIRDEIRDACPRLITDGSRPFRVFFVNFGRDHLEIKINAHFRIAPLGDAYWINRQNVLTAIYKAVKDSNASFAVQFAGGDEHFPVVMNIQPSMDEEDESWEQEEDKGWEQEEDET